MSQPEEGAHVIPVTVQNAPAGVRAIAPLPRRGSQAGSQARSTWADLVRWDGKYRPLDGDTYKDLPEVKELKELVKKSFFVPAWLANLESSQYEPYISHTDLLSYVAADLSNDVSGREYTKVAIESDEQLSRNVAGCLPMIMHVLHHTSNLEFSNETLGAVEADRRHLMDGLGSLVWDLQSGGRLAYRAERQLQIPHPSTGRHVRPDSCAFIPIPKHIAGAAPPAARSSLLCLMAESNQPNYGYLLHWVTEFKRLGQAENSRHQVVEGLVSALYQRRAFGFPNHFVFGTAYHSRTTLEVLAATWVPSESDNPGACSMQEPNAEGTDPAVGQVNAPSGSGSRGVDTAGGESKAKEGADKMTIEEIKKHNKIVVYAIAEFSMTNISHLLQLYLLMRYTRKIAEDYRDDIEKNSSTRIRQLLKHSDDIYKWAPPPPPASDRGSKRRKTESEPDSRLPDVDEEEHEEVDEDSMSVDQDDSSGSISDPQELDSLGDPGPTYRIAGDGTSYIDSIFMC
ncbi:unnamed protein product [Rhizoctonia solani]|uniref:Uncharacterized protein n=1 Tax=Rhizoctonia solani TaxID=456999 RepID=A0A8H3HZS1_9AGAM|nr:unnamed protein product [Rhizoctonia solani]